MRYTGGAALLVFGRSFRVDARLDWSEDLREWSGVLTRDLDWENLTPGDVLALEVPSTDPADPLWRCPMVIDLIVGHRVAAHGWAPDGVRRVDTEISASV